MRDDLTPWQKQQVDHSIRVLKRFSRYTIQHRNDGRWKDLPGFADILGLRRAQGLLDQYVKTRYKGRLSDIRIVPKMAANYIRETRKTG